VRNGKVVRVACIFLLIAFVAGCGSRPGVEEDFTSLPEPEGIDRPPTDEELEEAKDREREERLQMIDELREEERRLYVRSDEDFELRSEPEAYRLSAGDRFQIRFAYQKEMNAELMVRPDGGVSFDLIGELPVAGSTPDELARTLEEMYTVYLRDPQINIVLREFKSQRFFVLGEVQNPGEFPFASPTTLAQAVATAGSWTDEARMEDVIVIRMGENRTPFAFKINLKEVLGGAVHADPYLKPMDIVYVPMGKIASARNFTERFFDIILPPIDAAWKTSILTGYRN